jgi:O-antigen ligase
MKRASDLLAFVFGTASVVALGFDAGGFYPRAWEWGTLAALLIVIAGVVYRRGLRLAVDEWRTLVALGGLAAWIAVTVAFTADAPTLGVPELGRAVFYVAVFWAALMLPRDRSPWALQSGVLAGTVVVCVVGLVEFLFPGTNGGPDFFEDRNLFQPVGYANAFGILAGIGALLALGVAAGSNSRIARASAAAALVPILTALFLTSSRGAVAATILGFVVMLWLEPERRRLLVVVVKTLPLPVLALLVSAHSRVQNSHVPMSFVARDGKIVAITVAVLTLAAGLVALYSLPGGRAEGGSRPSPLIAGVGIVVVALVLVLGGLHGGLGDRPHYWHAAWLVVIHHPWLGSGAGSFGAEWLRYRTVDIAVQDAHSLYLETLAELGPLGLFLLLVALALPLRRVRRTPSVAPVCGAYAAFLAHSALDWDWELPVVTVAALLCGASLLHARRPQTAAAADRFRVAPVAAAVAACIALLVLNSIALVGSISLHQAVGNLQSRSWTKAEHSARTASRWQPWSAEPYDLLGQAQLARGQRKAAVSSFRHALRLDDRRWQTWYELGRIGTGAERRVALEHILALNPRAVLESH